MEADLSSLAGFEQNQTMNSTGGLRGGGGGGEVGYFQKPKMEIAGV